MSRELQVSLNAAVDALGRHDGFAVETLLTWRKRAGKKLILAPSVGVSGKVQISSIIMLVFDLKRLCPIGRPTAVPLPSTSAAASPLCISFRKT